MIIKQVYYASDIVENYNDLFRAAYHKANIWPDYDTYSEAENILAEECLEADEKVKELLSAAEDNIGDKTEKNLQEIKAQSVNAICELLQVIAVCNKYKQFLRKEGCK